MRVILFTIIIIASLLPSVARAQLDPRCWTREDCIGARAGFNLGADQRPEDGFYSAAQHSEAAICGEQDAQGQELGFCLPATKTVTEISFGGKREFANIGEFIQLAYRYAIIIAGILATVVIMLAGIRWTASGGNAERIKSAQKMIGGAIAGLLIALLSYTILNVLNPATVNLRLPQVWLIRTQDRPARYCDQLPANESLAKITPKGAAITPAQRAALKFDQTRNTAECGYNFALSNNNQTCLGLSCLPPGQRVAAGLNQPSGKICAPTLVNKNFVYNCAPGILAGTISGQAGFFAGGDLTGANAQAESAGTESDDLIDVIKLIALCADGTIDEVASIGDSFRGLDGPDPNNTYLVPATASNIDNACQGTAVGFYLGAEINDETFGLGAGSNTSAGEDDWFAVGQAHPGSHQCNVNLSKLAVKTVDGIEPKCALNECTCALLSDKEIGAAIAKNEEFKKHLISPVEIRGGYVCDITITRSTFPSADNADFFNYKSVGAAVIVSYIATPAAGLVAGAVVGTITGFDDPTNCTDKS